ncbi:50S ribosomal protein L10 [Candidatus Annandia pinicola]|uniref:50S ribosomal protein L10 n=1 Tax=Candidatus Annandia pinicola TaxID=1345117 RepID=UPI001D028D7E|nr:50S ribosomal protein L10 [Candidatus Annandia pinicola]UDG80271.1 50S ribosomal protein L10 [Candidatus Annandia pinicola]
MILSFNNKKKIVNKISKIISKSLSIIIISICGIEVNKITELRKKCIKNKVYLKIVQNNLLKISIKNTKYECLENNIVGPTMMVCSLEHPGTAARLLKDFLKENKKLSIKAASFEGKLITSDKIDILTNLPTYKESLINLINILKEISIGKFIKLLNIIVKKKK